eukprot:Skav234171  [mRNA]  locus=scaffold572:306185:308310:- [translate_table: standard]
MDLTPPVADPHEIEKVAHQVWSDFTLELIGSSLVGTAICKRHGQQSDRDYLLKTSFVVTPQEWKQFFRRLEHDWRFRDVSEGRKAIKFKDQELHLEWEIVPACGHFSYDLVTFPTLDGALCTEGRNTARGQFFKAYPGAVNAVKVLKRLCPQLTGNMVEALAFRQGKDLLQNDSSFAERDSSGLCLFQHLVQLFELYRWSPDENSPLAILCRDAEKYGKDVKPALENAARVAMYLRMRTTEESAFCVCMSARCARNLMFVIGLGCAFLLELLVHWDLWLAVLPEAFAEQALHPHANKCPEGSCFCSDLRERSYECLAWSNYTKFQCEFSGYSLNRCAITFWTGLANGFSHCWICYSSARVAFGHSKHRDVFAVSVCVCAASFLVVMFHLRFLGLGDTFVMYRVAGNLLHCLCMATSTVVLASVQEAGAQNPRFTQMGKLGLICASSFLLPVLTLEIVIAIGMVFLRTDRIHFVSQNHVLYTFSVVTQLFVDWITCTCASREMKAKAGLVVLVQLLWVLVDIVYWAYGHFLPEEHVRYSLLVMIACWVFLALKLVYIRQLSQLVKRRFDNDMAGRKSA